MTYVDMFQTTAIALFLTVNSVLALVLLARAFSRFAPAAAVARSARRSFRTIADRGTRTVR